MVQADIGAWLAEIELCDNMASLDLVYSKLQELDREIGGTQGPLCNQAIVHALVAQRAKLQVLAFGVWETQGMTIANLDSIKKLELASNKEEAERASRNIKEGRVLWTTGKLS